MEEQLIFEYHKGVKRSRKRRRRCVTWNFVLAVGVAYFDTAFVHGYNISIVAQIGPTIADWVKNTAEYNLTKSVLTTEQCARSLDLLLNLGAAIGSLFIPTLANHLGRKGGILFSTFIGVFGSLLCGYSKYFHSFFLLALGLLILGTKTGINSILVNMYVWEISPSHLRNNIASLYGSVVSFGYLTAIVFGDFFRGSQIWPLVFSVNVIPTIVLLIFFPQCPESPRYLFVVKSKITEVKKGVTWFTGRSYTQEEIGTLSMEYNQYKQMGGITLKQYLHEFIFREALLVSSMFMLGQQLSGVSTMVSYLNHHLKHNKVAGEYYLRTVLPILMFFVMIITSLISSLMVGARFTIKYMSIVSFFSIAFLCLLLIFVATHPFSLVSIVFAILMVLFSVAYKIGVGTHAWYIPSEYFSTANSPIPYAVSYAVNWLTRVFLVLYFVPFVKMLDSFVLFNYAFANALMGYYMYKKVPDSTSITLKDLYRKLYKIHRKSS